MSGVTWIILSRSGDVSCVIFASRNELTLFQIGGYNNDYKVDHHDGKGRVGEWMKAQPSEVAEDGMTWSAVSTGPYMEMLNFVSTFTCPFLQNSLS